MISGLFQNESLIEQSSKWTVSITRKNPIYNRNYELRTEFYRDYSRILHCQAYRRLKHKTQVFFATNNDHICTRMEHVNHVASVSYTIAKFLGLNTELTNAIAIGHDIGHAPFGHAGETILNDLAKKIDNTFWHEQNGLYVCDNIATLQDINGKHQNLNLTYAVRDGIISHCGEINENALFPRNNDIDLSTIKAPNEYRPFTWEACVVKISDKIAYLGRDIEDAMELRIMQKTHLLKLKSLVYKKLELYTLNNTVLMHNLITDLCKNSNPNNGLFLSEKHLELINEVKDFNLKYIYTNERIEYYKEYSKIIINTIYCYLENLYCENLLEKLNIRIPIAPNLIIAFRAWLYFYSNIDDKKKKQVKSLNSTIYNIKNENEYKKSIIDFIGGMTDNFAIKMYHEIISF